MNKITYVLIFRICEIYISSFVYTCVLQNLPFYMYLENKGCNNNSIYTVCYHC